VAVDHRASGNSQAPTLSGTERSSSHKAQWEWLAELVTTWPWNAGFVLATLGVTLGMGLAVPRLATTNDFALATPRGTQAAAAYGHLSAAFGPGYVNAFHLMMESRPGETVLSRSFWVTSQEIVRGIIAGLPETDRDGFDVQLFNYIGGSEVPWYLVAPCTNVTNKLTSCKQLLSAMGMVTNEANTATWGYIRPGFDPMGPRGRELLPRLRKLTDDWSARTGVRVTIGGGPAVLQDTITLVYDLFPRIIGATMCIVLVLLMVAFGSVLFALRSILSASLTLIFVYGLAIRVYQDGIFDRLSLPNLSGEHGALVWAAPVICFNIVVGLCVDYDIFLFMRATEFRMRKMGATSAVRRALCSTGSIITAAGLVMATAFGGLLFSSVLQVAVLAFFIVVAVLYDTFVVRCVFTPAIMSFFGRYNWWPSALSQGGVNG